MGLTFQKGQGSKIFISKLTCNDKSIKVFSVDDVEYYNNYFRIATDGVGDVCIYAQATLPSELVVPSVYKGQVATGIGNYAFYQCTEIKRVTIQDGIEKISHSAFLDCTNLKRITIPDSVDDIITSAFENCTSLIDIALPDKITGISDATFKGCTNLTTIIIPVGLKRISKDAFKDCTSLSKVYYKGTANDWGGITGSEEGNECLANATCYYYSETKPETEGNYWHYVDGEIFEWDGSACENGHTWVKTICSTGTVCTKCGKLKGDADECTWGEWEITKRQNCTEAGQSRRKCSVCGATKFELYGTPLGHDYGDCIVTPPTCIEKGYTEQICLRCGDSIKEYTEEARGHTWSDWVLDMTTNKEHKECTVCGLADEREHPFIYELLENDTYSVKANGNLTGDIEIPSRYNGKDVTQIAKNGFAEQGEIVTVIIPEGVTSIDARAFYGCSNLVSLVIPKSVTNVGDLLISNINSVFSTVYYGGTEEDWANITIGETNYELNDATIYYYSEEEPADEGNYWYWEGDKPNLWSLVKCFNFYLQEDDTYSVNLKSDIDIPDEIEIPSYYKGKAVTIIGEEAFYQRDTVVSVKIPYTITSIGMNAFDGCSNLKDVYITDVEAWLNIEFSDEHDTYYAHPNIYGTLHILDKNDNEITEVVVPSSITQIKDCAFRNATNLTHITLHDKVKRIEWGAFKNCSSLQEFTIPDSVEYIGHQTLNGCSSIVSIVLPYIGNFDWKNENHFYEYPLGYHFGTAEYEGGVATVQEYYSFWEKDNPGTMTETKAFYIPEGLRTVEVHRGNILHGAFQNCTGITKITLPTEIDKIGKNSFLNCENLEDLIIPVTLQEIDYSAFAGCSKVIIQYYGDDKKYRIENNCLVEVEGESNEIIFGNQNSEIPSTASAIGSGAFYGNTYLAPIKIPLNIVEIGSLAFGGHPVTVHVEAKRKPSGWADDWCDDNVTVVWGCKEEDDSCSHSYGGWTTTVLPTCTRFGRMQRTCSICGNVDIALIDPLEHEYETVVTEPTCLTKGYTDYICKRCGAQLRKDYTAHLGHDWDKGFVRIEPTCTENGVRRHTCTRCGDIADIGISALRHDWGEWRDIHPATCEVPGTRERICSRCGDTEYEEIPANGHDWDVEVEVVEPTCTDGGYTIHKCNNCAETYWDNYTDPLGHNIVDGICTRCGHSEKGIVYYGVSAIPERYNSSFVLGLTNKMPSDSHLESISVTPLEDEYIYYCSPTAFGDCAFAYNNFVGGFTLIIEGISITNAGGKIEAYNIYKSNQANLGANGAITITIKEMG